MCEVVCRGVVGCGGSLGAGRQSERSEADRLNCCCFKCTGQLLILAWSQIARCEQNRCDRLQTGGLFFRERAADTAYCGPLLHARFGSATVVRFGLAGRLCFVRLLVMTRSEPRPGHSKAYGRPYRREREALLAANPLCAWGCGRAATTADHVPPLKQFGGDSDLWREAGGRLIPACKQCNHGQRAARAAKRGIVAPAAQAAEPEQLEHPEAVEHPETSEQAEQPEQSAHPEQLEPLLPSVVCSPDSDAEAQSARWGRLIGAVDDLLETDVKHGISWRSAQTAASIMRGYDAHLAAAGKTGRGDPAKRANMARLEAAAAADLERRRSLRS